MDFDNFKQPFKKYRPMVRWWWPGLDVSEMELRREIRDLDEAGFGGAELQPFFIGSPLDMAKKDPERLQRTHRFMQPFHYKMMQAVLDEAKKHGLFIDITNNSAWPTGGTHISEENSFKTLLFATTVIKGGHSKDIAIPPLKKPSLYKFLDFLPRIMPSFDLIRYIGSDKRLVKVIAGKLSGKKGKIKYWKVKQPALLDFDSMIDLTSMIENNKISGWNVPKGDWQLFACYEGSAGSQPLMDCRSSPKTSALVVDHFDRTSITNHLDEFLGKGKDYFGEHFGTTFRAFFTDSFELISPLNWKYGFLDEFQKRRGYDLSRFLPVVYIPLRDVGYYSYQSEVGQPCFDFDKELGDRIRYDYERTISDLFIDEFIKVLQNWGRKNNLQSRVQGYGIRADNLEMLGYSGIPETEQLYGGGMLHFLKFAGAAGSLYQRQIISAESLVWDSRPYMTTILKWRVAADKLFEAGINQLIYHGFPYRHPAYPFPGFQPFSSPHLPALSFSGDFSRDSEFWQYYPRFNQYITRMQYLLQESKVVAQVAIFYSLFDFPNGSYKKEEMTEGVLDDEDGELKKGGLLARIRPEKEPTGERLYVKEMAEFGDHLVANGYYYYPINQDRLLHAEIKDHKMIVGDLEIKCLIFFKQQRIPYDILSRLEEINEAQIPIIFIDSIPTKQFGYLKWEKRDLEVKQTIKAIINTQKSALNSHNEVVKYLIDHQVFPQIKYSEPRFDIGFMESVARKSTERLFMIRNRTKRATSVQFSILEPNLSPYLLDAEEGEKYQIPNIKLEDNQISISLQLEKYQSKVIGFGKNEFVDNLPLYPKMAECTNTNLIKSFARWKFVLKKRELTGEYSEIHRNLSSLQDWREEAEFKYCSGPGEYETTFTLEEGDYFPKKHYILRFDRICDVATVRVNNTLFPALLLPPYTIDISKALKLGNNSIKVILETTYCNMLVGYGVSGNKTYKRYKNQSLMPAGLIGKVNLHML